MRTPLELVRIACNSFQFIVRCDLMVVAVLLKYAKLVTIKTHFDKFHYEFGIVESESNVRYSHSWVYIQCYHVTMQYDALHRECSICMEISLFVFSIFSFSHNFIPLRDININK